MKLFLNLLTLLLPLMPLSAETIFVESRGDYASIDVKKSNDLIELICAEATPQKKKEKACKEIAMHPGSYHPFALLAAGTHFLKNKDYDKAAPLCAASIFRARIDVLISHDRTLGDVPTIAAMEIGEVVNEYLTTENERNKWAKSMENAIANFEAWDKQTPRDYDDRWVRLHSLYAFNETTFTVISEAEKKKLIEKFYQKLRGEENEEDLKALPKKEDFDETDEDRPIWFYDYQRRIFSHDPSGLSFYVPKSMKVDLSPYGELSNSFCFSDKTVEFWLNYGHSYLPKSLEQNYEIAQELKESNRTVERITISNGIPGYRERCFSDAEVVNHFHIVHGHYSFDFELICSPEKEATFLEAIQTLLNSVRFSS